MPGPQLSGSPVPSSSRNGARPPRSGERPSALARERLESERRRSGSAAALLRYAGIAVGAIVVMAVLQRLAQP